MLLRTLTFISTILLLSLTSCRKCDDPCNKECDNYDPCCLVETVSADFRVRPGDRGFTPPPEWCDLIPTDTFNESSVRFDVPLGNPENSSYEWQIGTETETRTAKGFEISFYDYLQQGNWESSIPVTLTVRTPYNACWENPKDTLITVTRELFFTQEQLNFWGNDSIASYKGYISYGSTIKEEVEVTYINQQEKYFRGISPPLTLIVGLPVIDTLLLPKRNCGHEFCRNFKHQKTKYFNVETCSDSPFTNYMTDMEWIFIDRERHIKQIFLFKDSPSLEFTGVKF